MIGMCKEGYLDRVVTEPSEKKTLNKRNPHKTIRKIFIGNRARVYIWGSASCIVTVSGLAHLRAEGTCPELIGQLQLRKACCTWKPSGDSSMVTVLHHY